MASSVDAPPLSYRAEVLRKTLHIATALVLPMGLTLVGMPEALLIVGSGALVGGLADGARARSETVNAFIRRVFGGMMRAEELPPPGGPVRINGATQVLIGATVLVFIFPLSLAAPVLTMTLLADAAAALVGRRLGRRYWPGTHRTVEGSLAFVLSGLLVFSFFPALPIGLGAAGVLAGAAAEVPTRPLDDNVRVPLAAAAAMTLVQTWAFHQPLALFPWTAVL